jgi:UDP-N-acetylmuramate dehydrogenase
MIILKNELMSNHTSFKIGGPARFLMQPESYDELVEVLDGLQCESVRYMVIGNGSNLLFADEGFEGVIVKTNKMSGIKVNGERITVDCGVSLAKVASVAQEAGLSGLEFASGIPGSIGGAVYMNAGAYDGEMSQIVESSEWMSEFGELSTIDNEGHGFGYRSSVFGKNKGTLLQTTLKLTKGESSEIKAKMKELNDRRTDKQPLDMPSAGSVFKRPESGYAAQMIEECGLKGLTIGGAQVSLKHSGFIVNVGGATAKDVLELMKMVKDKVYEKKGVMLEEEINCVS